MSKSTPLISVCMLTYNHEAYISEAILSVINQSYDNWELIIVDNASTDKTKDIIEKQILNEDRIYFLPQKENTYVSTGINIAIDKAKGEYIALFSGDDVYKPEKLKEHLAFMLAKDLELSFTWVTAIGANSKPSSANVQKWFNDVSSTTKEDILSKYLRMHNVTYGPTVMIKKTLLNKSYYSDHRLLQTQDMEWWIRLMHHTEKVGIYHKELTNYRVIEDGSNLSSNNTFIKTNRTNFEMIQIWKELYTIDNKILSKVLNVKISDNNKDKILFAHLKKQKVDVWQYAMLLSIYQDLTEKCDTTSSKFKLFFEEYGNFSTVSGDFVKQKEESIKWLEEQLENHKKSLSEKEEGITWLEKQLENHKKSLSEKEENMACLEEKLSEQGRNIVMRDNELKKYQSMLEKIDEKVFIMEQEMENKVLDLTTKEQTIALLNQRLAYKETFKGLTRGLAKKIILKIKRLF